MTLLILLVLWYVTGFIAPLYFLKRAYGTREQGHYGVALLACFLGPIGWLCWRGFCPEEV